LIDDHDERAAYGREVAHLMKELWTHPAPERVTFEGKHVRVRDLPFNPAPVQKPHPPIWIGGDSEATLRTVKEVGDGWVMLRAGQPEIAKARSAPDWPQRDLTLVKGARLIVAETHDQAISDAREEYDALAAANTPGLAPTFEGFVAAEVVGSPEECLARLAEIESWGPNYLRLNFRTEASQDKAAALVLPRLDSSEPAQDAPRSLS
jgi:alkanesulfonate monooxygenase SsuD/methylene tetrahydromethanopterin reductase-like flavin-dependent oxidoreductase (luciferase family)